MSLAWLNWSFYMNVHNICFLRACLGKGNLHLPHILLTVLQVWCIQHLCQCYKTSLEFADATTQASVWWHAARHVPHAHMWWLPPIHISKASKLKCITTPLHGQGGSSPGLEVHPNLTCNAVARGYDWLVYPHAFFEPVPLWGSTLNIDRHNMQKAWASLQAWSPPCPATASMLTFKIVIKDLVVLSALLMALRSTLMTYVSPIHTLCLRVVWRS